jgi:hypothetical protein
MSLSAIVSSGAWRGHLGAGAAAVLLFCLGVWAVAYGAGAFPWLGYAWISRSSFGAGPVGIIGETSAGTELGFSTFLFFKGQEITVAYDADIKAGSLGFYVYRPYDGTLGDGVSHYVTESGAGEWSMPVPATGIYHITIEPSPAKGAGRGYDLIYTAWWGARRGR